jgi:hypothetical protein
LPRAADPWATGKSKIMDAHSLTRTWVHSHEEDTADHLVFRPDSWTFPPSRGRRSFELKADGGLVERGPGPDDRIVARTGSWKLSGADRLQISYDDPAARDADLKVTQAGPDKLVLDRSAT